MEFASAVRRSHKRWGNERLREGRNNCHNKKMRHQHMHPNHQPTQANNNAELMLGVFHKKVGRFHPEIVFFVLSVWKMWITKRGALYLGCCTRIEKHSVGTRVNFKVVSILAGRG